MKCKEVYECYYLRYTIPESVHTYTPDFILPNGILIEAKGLFETADRKKHLLIKKQYPQLFNEQHYSPHSFRHSIAVHMLEANVPLPVIKTFLGHECIQTTMIYATVSDALKDKYLLDRHFPILENDNTNKKYSVKEDLIFL